MTAPRGVLLHKLKVLFELRSVSEASMPRGRATVQRVSPTVRTQVRQSTLAKATVCPCTMCLSRCGACAWVRGAQGCASVEARARPRLSMHAGLAARSAARIAYRVPHQQHLLRGAMECLCSRRCDRKASACRGDSGRPLRRAQKTAALQRSLGPTSIALRKCNPNLLVDKSPRAASLAAVTAVAHGAAAAPAYVCGR